MADCVLADDAYLIQAWPMVVITTPGSWLVTIVAAAAGSYVVTVGGVPYAYEADGTETLSEIRGELLTQLSMGLTFGVSPVGPASAPALLIIEAAATGLTVDVSGPITVSQIAGSSNAATRAFWLARAECGLPDCCYFCGCKADYTLYHASLAAHMILVAQNTGPTGYSATDFESMRLGPAALTRGAAGYEAPTENALAKTSPGQTVLMLRRRYLPFIICA